jgi:shikimate dehydrogenase
VRSALKLGHARGIVLLAASQASVPVAEYTPAEIKRSVVGYGRAEKQQVQGMMKLLLGLDAAPSPHDVADALAVADGLAHATPTGMAAHPGMPLPAELLRPDLWVADIVYRPLETALVRTARERGCRVLDGGGMAVYQAVDAFRLFTGVEPDADRMLAHFTELVSAPGTDARVG